MDCGCHFGSASPQQPDKNSNETTKNLDLAGTENDGYDTGLWKYMNRNICRHRAYEPTKVEHMANVFSHGIAIIPAFVGLYMMYELSDSASERTTSFVYGTAIIWLFISSTIYHVFELLFRPNLQLIRFWLHIGDRASIYLYIAASYHPWLTLRDCGWLGMPTLYFVWAFAVCGIIYQYIFHERYKTVETLLYVIIGACPAVIATKMNDHSGLSVMAAAGACYVVGIVFFKSDGKIPFAHAIWHFHVVAGAFLQFVSVYYYLFENKPNSTIYASNAADSLRTEALHTGGREDL